MNRPSAWPLRFRLLFIGVLLVSATAFAASTPAPSEPTIPTAGHTFPWTRADAAHLLRRAGFGGTPQQIDKLFALGRDAAVDYLLDGKLPAGSSPVFAPVTLEDFKLPPVAELSPDEEKTIAAARAVKRPAKGSIAQTQPTAPADEALLTAAKALKNKGKRDQQKDVQLLRAWWLDRMIRTDSTAATLPLFLDRSARTLAAEFAANPAGAGRPDRILVVVQLAGGNDGLNTVVPIGNDDYYKARPTLAIPRKLSLRIDDNFGFHPAATGLKKLWDDGNLAVMHSVGYPNFNRSHFRGTDIWQTAMPDKVGSSGWLGRYFDACCCGEDPGPDQQQAKKPKTAAPNAAIALTGDPPTTLLGEKFIPLSFHSPNELTFYESNKSDRVRSTFDKLNSDIGLHDPVADADHMAPASGTIHIPRGVTSDTTAGQTTDFIQRSALNARVYADSIKKSVSLIQNKAAYPASPLADQLKLVAQMIAAELPTRVYYVRMGGFDTHSGQEQRHQKLMEELGGGLAAFVDDLKALGHLDRTTVMTFSEFGRRVAQNGSGTDHGEAAPLFVMGSAIKPGFHGTAPELHPDKLHRGDVPFSQDFRSVYGTMLAQWLRGDDTAVLGGKFARTDLFKPGAV